MGQPAVLVLAGVTASGKTELAITLAKRFDAEIVGADSRQIYRGMPVGTGSPSPEQLAAIPHHLVGFLDPHERYSAARFANDATLAIEGIHARGKRAIVAGGTGFYIRALTGGVELAGVNDEALRVRLLHESRTHEPAFLYEWLCVRDPRRARALHPGDSYRVLRALEVALSVRDTPSSAPLRTLRSAGIAFRKVYLSVDRAVVDRRIEERIREMLAHGLLEEAERIGAGAVAANAVGYPQALAYLRGWSTLAELHDRFVRATKQYARRQARWFRYEPEMQALEPEALEGAARELHGWV